MKKSELIFGRLSSNPGFLSDLSFFVDLSKEKLDQGLEVFLNSKYRFSCHNDLDSFAENLDLSLEKAHAVTHLIDILAYQLIPKYEIKDIVVAINELTQDKAVNVEYILNKLKSSEVKEILDIMDLVDDEIGTINPHFKNITYNIQERIVVKDDKIIKKIAIVLLKIDVGDKEKSIGIEFLGDDLDKLINGLGNIKKKLNLLSVRENL